MTTRLLSISLAIKPMSDTYIYRAMASPCNCEITLMEKTSIPFDHLQIIGTGHEPCEHGNEYLPMEVVNS